MSSECTARLKYHVDSCNMIVIEKEFEIPLSDYELNTLDYKQIISNDTKLMNQINTDKTHSIITYLPIPPEDFPKSIKYIMYYKRYMVYRERSIVVIYFTPINNSEMIDDYNYASDNILLDALVKYNKLIYRDIRPLNWLPNGVKILEITNTSFNHPLDNLPPSLEALLFNEDYKIHNNEFIFNHPLDNLPHGLKILVLVLMHDYRHQLYNLPTGLEYLVLASLGINGRNQIDNLEYLRKTIPNTITKNNFNFEEIIKKIPEKYWIGF